MKISALEEYGLRCMLQLAREGGEGSLTLAEIAEREGLSLPYVGKLMGLLREQGLVESVRGRGGGYRLPRPADQLTLREVLSPLGGLVREDGFCEKHAGQHDLCVHQGTGCTIQTLWGALENLLDDVLSQTTLAELASGEALANLKKRGGATRPDRQLNEAPTGR